MFDKADFSDLPEFGAGHATDVAAMTGCTCFVARGDCKEGAVCGVDVRGGGPATRETDLLRPENMVQRVNAVMIGGGSAFGLEAACGAMEALAREGVGFEVGAARVPIVPAACLFDLLVGKAEWPDKAMGDIACKSALAHEGADLAQGSVGAGAGATVGKMGLPDQAMRSGFGWSGLRAGELVVISCVAVNALGNVVAEDGSWLAGTKGPDGKVMNPLKAAMQAQAAAAQAQARVAHSQDGGGSFGDDASGAPVENTTLGVVLTNAKLTKAQATKVAQQAQDGYARAIRPVHTSNDGDTIFTMASCKVDALPDMVGIMAADSMEAAIRSAVRHA